MRRPYYLLSTVLFSSLSWAAAAPQYLLFTCLPKDDSMSANDVGPGNVEIYVDLTQKVEVLRNTDPKPGIFNVEVLQKGKRLTKIAIPATLHSIPLAAKVSVARGQGKLVAELEEPTGEKKPHLAKFEIETDASGTPVDAVETDLKNGFKMEFTCAWSPMIR